MILIEKAGWPKSKVADNILKTPFGATGKRMSGVECVLFSLSLSSSIHDDLRYRWMEYFADLGWIVLSRNCTT